MIDRNTNHCKKELEIIKKKPIKLDNLIGDIRTKLQKMANHKSPYLYTLLCICICI